MRTSSKISFIIVLILFWAVSCIDPYVPDLKDYESILVVDGLVTDENSPYEIRISRTMEDDSSVPEKVSDAQVYVTDDNGGRISFSAKGDGLFLSDQGSPKCEVGRKYTLHIKTSEGREYQSDACEMHPVPDIADVYFDKDSEFSDNNGTLLQGIKIFIDTGSGLDNNSFLRWEYEETWKFQVPNPKKYEYINDTTFVPVSNVAFSCWKSNNSGTILTGSVKTGLNSSLKKQEICFIPSDRSDRLTVRYSIEVKQYSVSPKEFDYWNNLKQVSETAGDIFETQPFPVSGNIFNVSDPDDRVLGYFQVSAVKSKRLFISPADLATFALPAYSYDCNSFVVSPENYPPPNPAAPAMTFKDIYNMFMAAGGFSFVEPLINPSTKKLQKLVFAPVECADCGLTGLSQRPDFWTDY